MKRTSHEKDSTGEYATLYLEVRDFIKIAIGNEVKEKSSQNITSFFSKEGGICSLRVKDNGVQIGWFRGRHINDTYGFLFGKGKIIRNQKVLQLNRRTRESIRYYISETLMFLYEHNALMQLKR